MSDVRQTKQVIVMRKDLNMRKGKMVAQGAHASIAFITSRILGNHFSLSSAEWDWIENSFTKICVGVESEDELLAIHAAATSRGLVSHLIRDAGLTEFGGVPTYTCCAIGPDWVEAVDVVCGKLGLL